MFFNLLGLEVRGYKDPQQPVLTFRSVYEKNIQIGLLEASVGSVFISISSEDIRFFFLDSNNYGLYFYLKAPPVKLHLKQKLVSAKDDPSNGILSRALIIVVEFTEDELLLVEHFVGQLGVMDTVFKDKEVDEEKFDDLIHENRSNSFDSKIGIKRSKNNSSSSSSSSNSSNSSSSSSNNSSNKRSRTSNSTSSTSTSTNTNIPPVKVLVSDIKLSLEDIKNHSLPESAFFKTWYTLCRSMQDGEEGDSFMQCPFTDTLRDTIGHGVYRSIKYTNGLPYRVELNSNGSMRTEKKDAKHGTLHFNCPCVHKFRTMPLESEALQEMLQKLGEPRYSAPVTSAVDMQNSSHAATAVGVAAAVKKGGRVRKLSKKSQQKKQEEEEKKKKGKEKKEKKKEKEKKRRRCWQYEETNGSDSDEDEYACTDKLWFDEVLGGLCKRHARCAVSELVCYINNQYKYFQKNDGSLLDLELENAEKYLSEMKESIVTSRKIYVRLLHELRFHYLCKKNEIK